MSAATLTARPAWQALANHHREIKSVHLRTLFADDPARSERFRCDAAGLFLDYSKNRITDETLRLLVNLAQECRLGDRIEAMFCGERINITENRPVLHVALRAPADEVITVDGKNVVPEVHAVLKKMADFSDRVRSGAWVGHTGKGIKNVVNIGIGGSDLGPRDGLRSAPSTTANAASPSASIRTSTARTSPKPRTVSTRPRRSSSSRRRPSRRSKP